MVEIVTTLNIDATPDVVWRAFSDSANWPKINRLLQDSAPGEPITTSTRRKLTIRPPGMPKLIVSPRILVAEAHQLCWRGGLSGVFWGEHYFRAEPHDGGTRWVHGERFGGLLSRPFMAWGRPRMERAYDEFNHALARFVADNG